jgi:opacity protein-like surface antigen
MHGLGAADPWVNTGLAFMSTTRPIATVGGGVVVRGGPVLLDVGYRFNRIFTNESLAGALTGGDVDGHQLRAGIGVSF